MTKNKYILALDQGTTSSRALVVNHAGEVVAVLSISRPLGATVERSMSLVRGLVSAVEAMLRRESGPVVGDEARALAKRAADAVRIVYRD